MSIIPDDTVRRKVIGVRHADASIAPADANRSPAHPTSHRNDRSRHMPVLHLRDELPTPPTPSTGETKLIASASVPGAHIRSTAIVTCASSQSRRATSSSSPQAPPDNGNS